MFVQPLTPKSVAYSYAFRIVEVNLHLQSEIKREKMSSLKAIPTSIAIPRRNIVKDDKKAIIEASKSPGFNGEEAMKKWGTLLNKQKTLLYTYYILQSW